MMLRVASHSRATLTQIVACMTTIPQHIGGFIRGDSQLGPDGRGYHAVHSGRQCPALVEAQGLKPILKGPLNWFALCSWFLQLAWHRPNSSGTATGIA